MKVQEVGDEAVADPVQDIAERSAQHHPERDLVDPVLLLADPHRDRGGDGQVSATSIQRPTGLVAFSSPSEMPWFSV